MTKEDIKRIIREHKDLLEIIGEATKNLSEDLQHTSSHIWA
ncbi:MAG: hypothetical protein AB1633_04405 [Elusimicrobiota bacterium]